jgi:Zn-dependent metalloprotease
VRVLTTTVLIEIAEDELGVEREFSCSNGMGLTRQLRCPTLNVSTYDYRKVTSEHFSPREYVQQQPPDPWDEVGVSAHANTQDVIRFLQNELELNGLDDNGLEFSSFVHYSFDDVFWHPGYRAFVYGRNANFGNVSGESISYASGISIVAHEIFHGITHFAAGLGCKDEPGALNESYSDIFGVILANRNQDSISHWNWEIGVPEGIRNSSFPVRDLRDPGRFFQPSHMEGYVETLEDQGGVHINNGIHNKAAYNLLISQDADGNYLFDVSSAAFLFYAALRQLRPKSDFSESRRVLTLEVSKCFQDDTQYRAVIAAVNDAFDQVGIP